MIGGMQLPLAHRVDVPELLESGSLSMADVRANLADLARLNRLPGGAGASAAAIARLVRGVAQPTIVDVGTGRGDMPLAFARRGWRTIAIDDNPQVLRVALSATRGAAGVEVMEAGGAGLPLPDGAVDVAHCSLLIHHLAPDQAVAVLREMARVARRGIVVNDLRRGILPLAVTATTTVALTRSRVTCVDGIASARRAYTLRELDDLLERAGLRRTWRSPPLMPRVVTAAVRR
jgi:ubiquinone/menaquinone biosynthesis C-methylase UbiE